MSEVIPPPDHVVAAFGLAGVDGEPLEGVSGRAWRLGDAVLKPAGDPVAAAWTAGIFDSLRVSGIRIPRPVRSRDGRWVVSGWCAQRFVSGRPTARYAEIVEASLLLHKALAETPRPRFLLDREDLYGWADSLAWGEASDETRLGDGHGLELFHELAAGRVSVEQPSQIIHGDLFGNVLFAGSAPPAIIDFSPFWRPTSYAAAIVVVDAISWGGAPMEFLQQWAELPEWGEMVRRATLFRLAVSLAHPRATPESLVQMLTVADAIDTMVS